MRKIKKRVAKRATKFHFDPFGKDFISKPKPTVNEPNFDDPMDTVGEDGGLSNFYQ